MWTLTPLSCPTGEWSPRGMAVPEVLQLPQAYEPEDAHLLPTGLLTPKYSAFSCIMRVVYWPQHLPRNSSTLRGQSSHIGVLFFLLLFAPSCFSKSCVRLVLKMLIEQPETVCEARAVERRGWGAGSAVSTQAFVC